METANAIVVIALFISWNGDSEMCVRAKRKIIFEDSDVSRHVKVAIQC